MDEGVADDLNPELEAPDQGVFASHLAQGGHHAHEIMPEFVEVPRSFELRMDNLWFCRVLLLFSIEAQSYLNFTLESRSSTVRTWTSWRSVKDANFQVMLYCTTRKTTLKNW